MRQGEYRRYVNTAGIFQTLVVWRIVDTARPSDANCIMSQFIISNIPGIMYHYQAFMPIPLLIFDMKVSFKSRITIN